MLSQVGGDFQKAEGRATLLVLMGTLSFLAAPS